MSCHCDVGVDESAPHDTIVSFEGCSVDSVRAEWSGWSSDTLPRAVGGTCSAE